MQHPELPAGAITALACLLVSLPSHIRAGNVASTSMNVWLALICLINAIDAFVWADDVIVRYPVYCDITTKLIIGSNVAFPAAAFCICRFLCDVSKPNAREQTAKVRRARAWVEIALCWVQPLIIMGLHFIVQGHRFDIFEYIGCQPTFYDSWPSLFIITLPPLVYCLGTFVYAGFAFYYFLQRRRQFEALLNLGKSGMNTNRYLRLMIVATAEMVWGTPWYLFTLIENFNAANMKPYISWAWVHSNWLRVGQYPLSLLPPAEVNIQLALWWMIPVSGYLFFIFFGFSEQAMNDYRACFRWVLRTVFRRKASTTGPQMSRLEGHSTVAQVVARSFRPRRKEERFEDFAKTFEIHIPPKAADEEAVADPDTWAGWVAKVARDDQVTSGEVAPPSAPGYDTRASHEHACPAALADAMPSLDSAHSARALPRSRPLSSQSRPQSPSQAHPTSTSLEQPCCPCQLEHADRMASPTGVEQMV